MNFPGKPAVPYQLPATLQKSSPTISGSRVFPLCQKILCGLIALSWPFAAALEQSSSSQQSSAQTQSPSQTQGAILDPPPQKLDSLAETARKAKEKKPPAAKGKVYTEDDLVGMKGPRVSLVGDAPKKVAGRGQSADPDGDGGENSEQCWRERARQILDALAQTDGQIAQKKKSSKKSGAARLT